MDSRIRARVDGLLDDARAARREGNWKLMRALAEAVSVLDPGNSEANELLVGAATRRQMTLLFCDIVGSTEMADALDPEEMTALFDVYRNTCAEVIERFDGYIDDRRGDGMLVLFGYPTVHEDDARRGVLCGLKITEALPDRLATLGTDSARRLRVRIAVHTDLVVVDGVGVSGATSNEAARIQEVAGPNRVVISDTTQSLVAPWFETKSLGPFQLRGVSRPIEIFDVLGEKSGSTRRLRAVDASPFVGRSQELEQITELWAKISAKPTQAEPSSDESDARAVLVTGPPGMGKTRLITEVSRTLDIACVECACTQFSENVSLHAFRPLLEASCGIHDTDGPQIRLAKLRSRLGALAEPDTDLPFLASALDIPLTLLNPPSDVDPTLLRERALKTAASLIESSSPDAGSMLFVDDLQWAEQSSLDLLGMILSAPRTNLMIVLAAREEFVPPWPASVVRTICLQPLDPVAIADMARLMPDGAMLSRERRQELIERSDGVPLFLEELLRTAGALESGRIPHRSLRYGEYKIPPALRDPLLARLALPSVDVGLAQAAATIGRDFDPVLLQRLMGDRPEFEAKLRGLFDAGLLEPAGQRVRFRHELIREVAYETQRQTDLQQRHGAIADYLQSLDREMTSSSSDQLAFHLERALRFPEAIAAHLRVARADQIVGSYVESTRRLTRLLDLLDRLPAGASRQQTELTVRTLRSFSAVMAGGYAASEAAEDYPRCVELSKALQSAREVLPHLLRSWSYYTFRGNLREADRVADSAARTAIEAGLHVHAQQMGDGAIAFFRGDFEAARRDMEGFTTNSWAASTSDRPPPDWPLPQDPLTAAYAHLVPTSWITGAASQAEAWAQRALERAADMQFPFGAFNTGYVKSLLAVTRNLQGDHVAAARLGAELMELGERHGFAMWQLAGVIQSLISAVHAGSFALIDQLVEHVTVWRLRLAADVWTPYWLTQVGFVQVEAGLLHEALTTFDDALAVATVTGSQFYSAETMRGRGQARIALGDLNGAEDVVNAADLASRQHARAFERRARESFAAATAR